VANFTAGTSFTDGVTNDVTAAKLNALVADAVPTANLSLNSTTGTVSNFTTSTATINGPITASTAVINVGSGQIYKDATGKVGVGTSSPVAKLDVYGDGYFQSIELGRAGQTGNRNVIIDMTGDDTYSDYGFRIIRESTGSNANTYLANRGTGALFLKTQEAGDIVLQTTNTERLRIDSSGNVMANTTSTTLFSATSGSGLCYRKGASLDILVTNDNALILNKIGADGSIAEFRKTATVVGTISVSGSATAYNTSSDYRLKTNLEPIVNGIDRIKQLPVYRFNWIADQSGNKVDGFVAHEAQAIIPECVTGEKDAVDANGEPIHQGIDQSKIVPLLTAALKEAIVKIETLEAKVTALEAA
jgi:hypothetical protein